MAVLRRVNWISQQRVDAPDMRSIESAASSDFDQLIQSFVSESQGYMMRGFNILMAGAIGGAASSLQLQVDPGALLHIDASQSGTVLQVPPGTPAQQLNAATNTNVLGSFSPGSINYVSIDYTRFLDDATSAQVYLWDPTSDDETTENAPRAVVLTYTINISTSTPTPNLLPCAIVLTDDGNNVRTITDARWLLCRLGTGGVTPNPFYTYPWPDGRTENPDSSSSDSTDPFSGGDKSLGDLKSWMNAVMSVLLEIKGTTYWYSESSSGSLESLREDLGNTVITGSGNISNGIIPNSSPVLQTTGTVTYQSNQLTGLVSTTGLAVGQYIFGTGIPSTTVVQSISGSTVTMSAEATQTITGGVSFYDPSVITAPGQINWDQPIDIVVIGSALDYVLSANPTSTNITLADDEAAYITLIRDQAIGPNLIFINGVNQVISVGAVAWTTNLLPGDFIKLASDTHSGYYEIDTVDTSTQVTLVNAFAETSTGDPGAQAQYAFGTYNAVPTPSTNRDIYISSREDVPVGQNVFWLFLREDNGVTNSGRVYIHFLGAELDFGDDREVSGTTSEQLLKYVGSPSSASSSPNYVSALNPGSVPQETLFTFDTEANTTQSSYFLIYSSANAREYYVWFNINGGGTDPNPGMGANFGVEVSITTGQTAAQVATAVTNALNAVPYRDFSAVQQGTPSEVLVTNTSAGITTAASPGTPPPGGAFAISTVQNGTGTGNNFIHDGDNLTLAIKELDVAMGQFFAAVDEPTYDQTIDIVASGATPPTSLNGPISATTIINLPNNSRMSNAVEKYTVGFGTLQVFLNGVFLRLGSDWNEVGGAGTLSNSFETLIPLEIGDSIELRISGIGSGGSGTGQEGPEGPQGPQGVPGADAAGGPVAVSTKTSSYTVLTSDNVLLADCTSASITFQLPNATSSAGHIFYFKKIDSTSNPMVLQAFGAQLIDGSNARMTIVQYESFTLCTDGTSWYIL